MKAVIAIIICKILYRIGKAIGKGSSLPGKVALRLCPDALKHLKLPKTIIAVTGSNGKTTTAEMIAHALISSGKKTAWNREGSNQTEGIATLLLRNATLGKKVEYDALVLECDERYANKIFQQVRPTALLVTNLCRDQLTRNGHPEFIYDCILQAYQACQSDDTPDTPQTHLILNADDPYVSALARHSETISGAASCASANQENDSPSNLLFIIDNITWYGLSQTATSPPTPNPQLINPPLNPQLSTLNPQLSTLNSPLPYDCAFCPVCKSRLSYTYRVTAHFGGYQCSVCGHSRPKPDYEVTELEYRMGIVVLNDSIPTRLNNPGIAGAYNLAAAIATVSAAGVPADEAALSLSDYKLTSGRTVSFITHTQHGTLLIAKHENSLAYNLSLKQIVSRQAQCTVIIIVDSISRKYYTSETSWLWDIDFDILSDECVQSIILSGRYTDELAARFALTLIDPGKIIPIPDLNHLSDHFLYHPSTHIYAITCFSDKQKTLKALATPQKNLKPPTPNSQLPTPNSQLSTPNSQLSSLNSQLSTLNSQLSTLNSQLSTLNSQLPPVRILHLYPDLMNLYGERANVTVLALKLQSLGCVTQIEQKSIGDEIDFDTYDFVYIGSGTERSQRAMMMDINRFKHAFLKRIEAGLHVLATGNSHELFGKAVTASNGERHEVLGFLDFETTQAHSRITGDCICETDLFPGKLIGFINRAGGGQKGEIPRPFTHKTGPQSMSASNTEGIRHKNLLGTYITGPILIRNPHLLTHIANELIKTKQGDGSSAPQTSKEQNSGTTAPPPQNPNWTTFTNHQTKAYKSALTELESRKKP